MGALERSRFGVYELLHEIARGGMAELYLARLHGYGGFERWLAIKRILPHLAHDQIFVDMFLNEARITALLQHRNICEVFDLCKAGDELLLVMEYLYGVTWDALCKVIPRDAWGLRLVAGVLAQACDGLHYAHTHCDPDGAPFHIVHRDVSPQNLLITTGGECKVLDFGVAKIANAPTSTRTGVLKGKVPYMSPEQLAGAPLDGRADVWALGVLLWEALAGRRLFDRETEFTSWRAITEEDVPPIAAEGGYPPAIDRVIARALERDRERRYPTARALGVELLAVAQEVGGALDAAEIAEAVQTRCAGELAARDRELAAATSKRDPSASYETRPPDAGETVSMLMRRDSVIVARPRRRRGRLVVAGASLAAVVAAVVFGMRGGDAPPVVVAARPAIAPDAAPPGPPVDAAPDASKHAAPAPVHPHRAIRAPAPRGTGTYAVDSTPYATIYIDGKRIGDTPLDRVSLAAGSHTVKAMLADGRHQTFAIEIGADRKTSSGMLRW